MNEQINEKENEEMNKILSVTLFFRITSSIPTFRLLTAILLRCTKGARLRCSLVSIVVAEKETMSYYALHRRPGKTFTEPLSRRKNSFTSQVSGNIFNNYIAGAIFFEKCTQFYYLAAYLRLMYVIQIVWPPYQFEPSVSVGLALRMLFYRTESVNIPLPLLVCYLMQLTKYVKIEKIDTTNTTKTKKEQKKKDKNKQTKPNKTITKQKVVEGGWWR